MRHFSFRTGDSFEPSLPTIRRPARSTGTSLARLLKQINKQGKRRAGSGSGFPHGSVDRRQLCIVKARYGHGAASLRTHLSYIKRQGAGKNGERPEPLGNAETSELTAAEAGNLRHYRLVISPETPESFPLETLARKLIQRVEYDTGYVLSWIATVHENTDHTHIHLVIGGLDRKGREVTFSRRYVSSQMREHTRDILTEALGDRRPIPEETRLKTDIKANRFTSLDEIIQMAGGTRGVVSAAAIRAFATPAKAEAAVSRLKFLEEVGLARREEGCYQLSSDWEESLNTSRRFMSYLEAAKKLQFTPQSLLRLFSPERDGRIVGRVSAIGLIDELSTNNYLLVETIDGRAYYVPLYRKPRGLVVGDSIALMKSVHSGAKSGETPLLPRGAQSSSMTSMGLLDVRFAKIPDERLKAEVRRLGKRRGGFGLSLS